MPVSNSSTRNSVPGNSVKLGAALSSPSPPPSTPAKAGKVCDLPVGNSWTLLEQFACFSFMATNVCLPDLVLFYTLATTNSKSNLWPT